VIRVESASRTCVTRLLPPFADGQPGRNRSGYFNQYNQGKLSLALDLKRPEAVSVALDLVAQCDIVCENFAAGVMTRMGLGYDVLRAQRPDLIMIALSGYGATGPDSEFVSYGPAQVPLSGLSSLTGYAGWPPMHVGISYGDPNGGAHGAVAVLAALLHRDRTGEGQYIDLSQWETSIAVIAEGVLEQSAHGAQPARCGNRDPHMAPHGVFRCAGEQRWVAIAVRDEGDWQRFAALIGPSLGSDARFADLAARKANEDALEDIVSAWTRPQTAEAVVDRLQAVRVPAFVSMNSKDLAEDPQLLASGFFVHQPHPEIGTRLHLGVPWTMSETPCRVRRAAPCLGEHTDDVLSRVIGYDAARIAALREAGVLA
jgi:benzylsuccinate CoA-transferase BbsF subunit